MALSKCGTITDRHQKELLQHGSVFLPIACYIDDLSVDQVPWHWHEEWECVVAAEGRTVFLLENARVILEPGDGIFINSQTLHAVESSKGSCGKLHSAVFHPRLIGGSMESCFWQDLVQPFLGNSSLRFVPLKADIPWQKEVLDRFENTWRAVEQEPDDYKNFLRYELSRGIRLLLNNVDHAAGIPSEQEQLDAGRVRSLLDYMEKHYQEDISLEALSTHIAVSESVCLRSFKRLLGTSPIQYVKQLRLEKAAEQLRSSGKSAKDIALNCGFNDVSYFTKIFREKYGQTPREYRKLHQKS